MPPLLQPLRLDTAPLPAERRFAAWAAAFERTETSPLGPPEMFHARSEAWLLGKLVLVRSEVGPLRMERRAARILADDADHYSFLVPIDGHSESNFDGQAHAFGPGALAVVDMRRPFRIDWGGGCNFVIYVPRPELEPVLAGKQGHGVHLGSGTIELVADFLRALAGALPGISVAAAPALGASLLMLLVATLRELPATSDSDGAKLATLRRRINSFVDAHPRAELTVEVLAARLGVSRSSLYRAYPGGGVLAALRQRRLAQVHRLLLDPNESRSLKEIAWARGFADLAQLSRQFRRQFGYSPAQLRAMQPDRWRDGEAETSVQERFKRITAEL